MSALYLQWDYRGQCGWVQRTVKFVCNSMIKRKYQHCLWSNICLIVWIHLYIYLTSAISMLGFNHTLFTSYTCTCDWLRYIVLQYVVFMMCDLWKKLEHFEKLLKQQIWKWITLRRWEKKYMIYGYFQVDQSMSNP
jgi:hypothetical protein